jgi:hypothetical protein
MKKQRFSVLLAVALAVAVLLTSTGTTVFAQEPDSANGVSHLHNPPEGEPPHGPPDVIPSMGNPQGPPTDLPPNAHPPGPLAMLDPNDPFCLSFDPWTICGLWPEEPGHCVVWDGNIMAGPVVCYSEIFYGPYLCLIIWPYCYPNY